MLEAAGAPPAPLPPLPADLTERELDVLRRLVTGRTKREIAAELVISASTVHTHTVHIYAKCEVSTRAGSGGSRQWVASYFPVTQSWSASWRAM